MSIFTKSVLNSIKLDESKVALANYHNLFSKLKFRFLFFCNLPVLGAIILNIYFYGFYWLNYYGIKIVEGV